MLHSFSLSEQQSLLHTNGNVQGEPLLASYHNGHASNEPLSSNGLDTKRNLGAFRSEGLPIWRAVFLMVNAAVGAGILNFPQAFAKCGGVINGIVIQLGLLVFITGAFLILAHCATRHGSQNFQDVVQEVLGQRAYVFIQIVIIVYMFASCLPYMILIGDQLESVGKAINPTHPWYLGREFLMCFVCIVFILPLCLPKTLKVVSYSSTLGTLGSVYLSLLAAVKYYEGNYALEPELRHEIKLPWSEAFTAVPIICFGFQCHVPSVAVYAEMKKATVQKFAVVVVIAMAISFTVYTITGSFGFLTFGATVKSDLLMNYEPNDIMVNVARVTLAVTVLSTSAVVLFCGRSCVESMYLALLSIPPETAQKHEDRRRIIQTLIWFTLCLIISINVPSIGYAVALIGGLATFFIFIVPGLCLVQEVLQHSVLTTKGKLLMIVAIMYVILGVFIFADSEVLAIMQDVRAKGAF